MGTSNIKIGKESSQEDTVYYPKALFELNLLVCGNYFEDIIERDLNEINESVEENYIKRGKHNVLPEWEYFFFRKDKAIGKNTASFMQNSIRQGKYKNLIIFYSGFGDYSYENLLEYYDKEVKPNYYPGILIIAKQDENIILPNLKKLNKGLIKISREYDLIDILIKIIQFAAYYNQLGDDIGFPKKFQDKDLLEKDNYLMTKYLFTINILLCGRPGAGKSTLINRILGKERSYAKIGSDTVTSNIIKYIHEKYPLVLYDSPGFEMKENVDSVQKLIKQKNKDLKVEKDRIHCVFYILNKNSERGFFGKEFEFIKDLIEQGIDIYIISTHAESEDKSDEYIEATKLQILQNSKVNKSIKDLENYIYPVELKNEGCYKRFGIKKLFTDIYNRYAIEKTPYEINQRNINEIDSIFLKDFLTKENLKDKLTALSLRIKANFKLLAASLGKDASVKGTTMLSNSVIKIISNIYNKKITTDESLEIIKLNGYTNEIERNEDNIRRKIEKVFASLFYFNGPASKEVDYIANYLIEKYNKEIDDDRNYYKLLNDYRIAINNAIDSLNNINDEDNE